MSTGGYYIGRYEAGDASAISSERTSSSDNNSPLVVKVGVYPYNYVTQIQASNLAQGMYSSDYFTSDLMNSYAWDTAIIYIQEFSGDNDYSIQSRLQSSIEKCGESTDGISKDVRCNIYDMSGNVKEWSTETRASDTYPCVGRGDRIRSK